jgi:uridine phosphorylase
MSLTPALPGTGHFVRCSAGDLAPYAIVPGDHARAQRLSLLLQSPQLASDHGGLLVYTGLYCGARVTVASTGMGGPSAAVCLEELGALGVRTFIRVGSCGTLQDYVDCGDIIISTAALRGGGTGNHYLPVEFPAVPDYRVTKALERAGQQLGGRVHIGPCVVRDAFYVERSPAERALLKQAGLIGQEMESDTLFVLAAVRGWRAGALFAVASPAIQRRPDHCAGPFRLAEDRAVRIALEAVRALAAEAD